MAHAIKEAPRERIEIVDQPDEMTEGGRSPLRFILSVVMLLTVIGAFLVVRRITSSKK